MTRLFREFIWHRTKITIASQYLQKFDRQFIFSPPTLGCLRLGCRRCTGRRSTEVPVLWSRYRALPCPTLYRAGRCRTDGTGAFVQLVRPPCRPVMSLDAPTGATLPLNSANNVTQYRPIVSHLIPILITGLILSSIKGERSANPIFLIPINIDYF